MKSQKPARSLSWADKHSRKPSEMTVPLTGQPEDGWVPGFDAARRNIYLRRKARGEHHIRIELHSNQVLVTEITKDEDDAIRRDLDEIVQVANQVAEADAS